MLIIFFIGNRFGQIGLILNFSIGYDVCNRFVKEIDNGLFGSISIPLRKKNGDLTDRPQRKYSGPQARLVHTQWFLRVEVELPGRKGTSILVPKLGLLLFSLRLLLLLWVLHWKSRHRR